MGLRVSQGHYCIGGQPLRCAENSWHNLTEQTTNSSCRECPQPGTECNKGDVIEVLPGYWMKGYLEDHVFKCASNAACSGGAMSFADASCNPGHSDRICGRCAASNPNVRRKRGRTHLVFARLHTRRCVAGWYRGKRACKVSPERRASQHCAPAPLARSFMLRAVCVCHCAFAAVRRLWIRRRPLVFALGNVHPRIPHCVWRGRVDSLLPPAARFPHAWDAAVLPRVQSAHWRGG